MGPICCPETSVRNYHYSLRNNPEQRISLVKPSCAYYKDKEGSTDVVPPILSPGSTNEWSGSRSGPFDPHTEPRHPFKWKLVRQQRRSGHEYFTCLETRISPTKLRTHVLPAISLLAVPTDYTTGSSGFRKIPRYETDKTSAPLFSNFCMRTDSIQNGGLRVFRHSAGSRVLRTSTWDEEGNKEQTQLTTNSTEQSCA